MKADACETGRVVGGTGATLTAEVCRHGPCESHRREVFLKSEGA